MPLAVLQCPLKNYKRVTDTHTKEAIMAYIAFVATVIVAGLVASFIPVDTISSKQDTPDYHLVPYAGDVFGA